MMTSDNRHKPDAAITCRHSNAEPPVLLTPAFLDSERPFSGSKCRYGVSKARFGRKVTLETQIDEQSFMEGSSMGSGSGRPNTADDKMFAAIERGDRDGFKDRKPVKNTDTKLIKEKEARRDKAMDKTEKLKALRLAAEQEAATAKK